MPLSKTAEKVMNLAREVGDYYAAELPKWHPEYPIIRVDEKNPPSPAAEKKLLKFLRSLPEEEIYRLLLVMYLGRGDFAVDELTENYAGLKDAISEPEYAVAQMMGRGPLADYLCDGLEELRKHQIDVDNLPLKKVAR